jgi:hypothetical protein
MHGVMLLNQPSAKVSTKNMKSNGGHLNWVSFVQYTGHLILAPQGK